jgi:hypothetical protein
MMTNCKRCEKTIEHNYNYFYWCECGFRWYDFGCFLTIPNYFEIIWLEDIKTTKITDHKNKQISEVNYLIPFNITKDQLERLLVLL